MLMLMLAWILDSNGISNIENPMRPQWRRILSESMKQNQKRLKEQEQE